MRPLRIAWSGETGYDGAGGVKGIAYLMLRGLAERGHDIEVFAPHGDDAHLEGLPVRTHTRRGSWNWDRWYAKGRLRLFLSSSLVRARVHRQLAHDVLLRHEQEPFDVIFQMSHLENFFSGRRAMDPPLVVHPCTIARLEWEWHRAEADLLPRGATGRFVSLMLRTRAALQGGHARRPELLVGPSPVFRADLQRAFGVPASRVAVLRHPVVLPEQMSEPATSGKLLLLFVSRMSSRKGVELVVGLSHRLADLAAEVEIQLVGGATLWSNYTTLLAGLHPEVAVYRGEIRHDEVEELMGRAGALLVPSRFEPGSIVTGEALARGVAVVASTAVGPSDLLDGWVFPDGDLDGFERVVRRVLTDLRTDPEPLVRRARAIAEQHLDAPVVVAELEAILRRVVTPEQGPAS